MAAPRITAPFSRLWHGFGRARRVWASRRELTELDDRMLQDLGISRAQAAFEAERWRTWHSGPNQP